MRFGDVTLLGHKQLEPLQLGGVNKCFIVTRPDHTADAGFKDHPVAVATYLVLCLPLVLFPQRCPQGLWVCGYAFQSRSGLLPAAQEDERVQHDAGPCITRCCATIWDDPSKGGVVHKLSTTQGVEHGQADVLQHGLHELAPVLERQRMCGVASQVGVLRVIAPVLCGAAKKLAPLDAGWAHVLTAAILQLAGSSSCHVLSAPGDAAGVAAQLEQGSLVIGSDVSSVTSSVTISVC